jgi:hypothetical protein
MDAKEAIGILRGDIDPASVLHRGIAEKMGAEALEFQGWLFGRDDCGSLRIMICAGVWNGKDSFLDFALGEWRKEKNNGNGR